MAATTFRTDVRAVLVAILEEQKTATPDLLRKVAATRPGFHELPCAYISNLGETIVTDQGTRTRTMSPEITVVDNFREGQADDLDQLVDLLVDRFTDEWSRLGTSAIMGNISTTDAEVEETGVGGAASVYRPAVVISLPGTIKREGRT